MSVRKDEHFFPHLIYGFVFVVSRASTPRRLVVCLQCRALFSWRTFHEYPATMEVLFHCSASVGEKLRVRHRLSNVRCPRRLFGGRVHSSPWNMTKYEVVEKYTAYSTDYYVYCKIDNNSPYCTRQTFSSMPVIYQGVVHC